MSQDRCYTAVISVPMAASKEWDGQWWNHLWPPWQSVHNVIGTCTSSQRRTTGLCHVQS